MEVVVICALFTCIMAGACRSTGRGESSAFVETAGSLQSMRVSATLRFDASVPLNNDPELQAGIRSEPVALQARPNAQGTFVVGLRSPGSQGATVWRETSIAIDFFLASGDNAEALRSVDPSQLALTSPAPLQLEIVDPGNVLDDDASIFRGGVDVALVPPSNDQGDDDRNRTLQLPLLLVSDDASVGESIDIGGTMFSNVVDMVMWDVRSTDLPQSTRPDDNNADFHNDPDCRNRPLHECPQ